MSELRVELRPLSAFTSRETEQLASLRDEIEFGLPPTTWLPPADTPWRVLVWQDDLLVSHVGIMERTIHVGGRPVHVAGIRSVMTRPAQRGRGYASAGMVRAAQYVADELPRAEHGLLLCLDIRVPLYSRLGWTVVPARTYFEQPEGRTASLVNTMVKPFRGRPWPPGEIDLQGLPW
jgi:GNAT superfamily N-acetyltransferase